jgi:hypothetical protein
MDFTFTVTISMEKFHGVHLSAPDCFIVLSYTFWGDNVPFAREFVSRDPNLSENSATALSYGHFWPSVD